MSDVMSVDCEKELKEWVEGQGEWTGRTDSDFLILFLRSCDFDLPLTKKTMDHYYQKRTMYPEWWANRDVELPGVQNVLRSNLVITLQEENPELPAVFLFRASKISDDPSLLNDILKTYTIVAEVAVRMPTCQRNGGVAVTDVSNCPSWIIRRFLWPPFTKKVTHSFLSSLPMKVKAFIFVNCTPIVLTALNLLKFFFPQHLKDNFHCFGSDLSSIGSVVPLELLPTEYGGSAGPISRHEEMFLAKVTSFNEYLLEDNKYGAPGVASNHK